MPPKLPYRPFYTDPTANAAFESFVTEKTNTLWGSESKSRGTIKIYNMFIHQFLHYCIDNNITLRIENDKISGITTETLRRFFARLNTRSGSRISSQIARAALKRFIKNYADILIDWDEIKQPRGQPKNKQIITEQDLLEFLQYLKDNAKTEAEEKARLAVILMWGAGLRLSECLGLHYEDISLEDNAIRLKYRKNSKFALKSGERVIPVLAAARKLITTEYGHVFMIAGASTATARSGPVFDTPKDPLTMRKLHYIFARAQIKLKSPLLHPHVLRALYATTLAKKGYIPSKIQEALGHRSLNTTNLYIVFNTGDIMDMSKAEKAEAEKPMS